MNRSAAFDELWPVTAQMQKPVPALVSKNAVALYAFANARNKNQMRQIGGDFEKGEAHDTHGTLTLVTISARVAMEINT